MPAFLQTLSNAPSEAWVGLIGVIIGAILSILGVWLTNQASLRQLRIQLDYQKSEDEKSIKRERLEELYILTDKWMSLFTSQFLRLSLVMKGQIDYNQYLDGIIVEGKTAQAEFVRLKMILDIYGIELKDDYKQIFDLRDEINDIISEHKKAYKNGQDGLSFHSPFADKSLRIVKLGESIMKKIAYLSNNL